jgi:hypothetical protein
VNNSKKFQRKYKESFTKIKTEEILTNFCVFSIINAKREVNMQITRKENK